MLRFFRRIRQGLLEKGRLQQYLLYAIGEIALVVIGILLALQINVWNQNSIDRINERDYLQQLLTELKADSLTLHQQQIRFENNLPIIATFLAALNESDNQKNFNQAFRRYLNKVWGAVYFNSNDATFEEMKSSAKLGIIADKQLRNNIVTLYNNMKLTEKVFEATSRFIEPIDIKLSFDYGFAKYLQLQAPMFDAYISEAEVFQLKKMKPLLESNAANWHWNSMDLLPVIQVQLQEVRERIVEIENYLNRR